MEIDHIPLPPQKYVVHENKLYKILWDYANVPPRLLITKDGRSYWSISNTIFSSNIEKRDIQIISLVEFYNLCIIWNIPIEQFNFNIPTL